MPAVLAYPLDQSSVEARMVDEAFAKEFDARRAIFTLRWQYYGGEMRRPLALQSDGVDDNVLIPKVGQVVDKVVSFLLGDGIEFDASTATDEGDSESDPTDDLLETIWRESRGDDTQHRLAIFGAITGHVFARVEPREGQPPHITALNPEGVAVFWDAFDQSRVLWYRLQHRLGEGGSGKRIDYVRGRPAGESSWDSEADGWTELVYAMPANGQRWALAKDPIVLDYCPIIDWQNLSNAASYYGQDETAAVLALNDALNFAASNYSRILKHYGTPKTIGLGFTVDQVNIGAGDLLTITKPPSEADVKYLEMQGDLSSVREWILMLIGEIWQAARMPDPQTMKDKVGALTNFGIRLMYNDALHKVSDKRSLYGEGFEKLGKLAIKLAGGAVPDSIEVVWPDPLPVDETAQTTQLQADLAAKAISVQTYAEARGYDWEREQKRIEEESAGQDDLGTRLLAAFDRGQTGSAIGGSASGRPRPMPIAPGQQAREGSNGVA